MTTELQLVSLLGLTTIAVGTAYLSLIHRNASIHVLTRLQTMIYGLLVVSVALFITIYTSAQ